MNKTRGSDHAGLILGVVLAVVFVVVIVLVGIFGLVFFGSTGNNIGGDPGPLSDIEGQQAAIDLSDRFIQQVNDDDCGASSGDETADRGPWTEACQAVVDNLAPGGALDLRRIHKDASPRADWEVTLPYRDVHDQPARVEMNLRGDGRISQITSRAEQVYGDTDTTEWWSGGSVELDATDAVAHVEELLGGGRCDEIATMRAQTDVFPPSADGVDCDTMVGLYNSTSTRFDPYFTWSTTVQTPWEVGRSRPRAAGVNPKPDELESDYLQRITESVPGTYIVVTKSIGDLPDYDDHIELSVVYYEQQWHLLNVRLETIPFNFTWP